MSIYCMFDTRHESRFKSGRNGSGISSTEWPVKIANGSRLTTVDYNTISSMLLILSCFISICRAGEKAVKKTRDRWLVRATFLPNCTARGHKGSSFFFQTSSYKSTPELHICLESTRAATTRRLALRAAHLALCHALFFLADLCFPVHLGA